MIDQQERVTKVSDDTGTQEVREVSKTHVGGTTLVARIVWYIAGVILTLLAFRFVLILLGANRNSGFADFIYTASNPLVAPFYGLFNYDLDYGVSRFEIYTLIAMAVYTVIAFGIVRLITLAKPDRREI